MVDLTKTTFAYIRAARTVTESRAQTDKKQKEAIRLHMAHAKRSNDLAALRQRHLSLVNKEKDATIELSELQDELVKVNNILHFIRESENVDRKRDDELDHYALIERKMMQQEARMASAAAIEAIIVQLEARHELEKQAKFAVTQVVEEPKKAYVIADDIEYQVAMEQQNRIDNGWTLGYSIDPKGELLTPAMTVAIIEQIAENIVLTMNAEYNEADNVTTNWLMMKGQPVKSRFLYVLVWECWRKQGERRAEEEAILAWETVFVTPDECARWAIQSRVNWRMTETARGQAVVWMKYHSEDIKRMEKVMSEEFEAQYPEDTAKTAIFMTEDETGQSPPVWKACAVCWMRCHPSSIGEVKELQGNEKSLEFESFFGEKTCESAFRILNGLCDQEDLAWTEHASQWKSFHLTEYAEMEDKNIQFMATKFSEIHPKGTGFAAAKIIEEESLSKYVMNEKLSKSLTAGREMLAVATSWGVLNQGLLRAGKEKLHEEYALRCMTNWKDLRQQTDTFRKGSYFFLSEEAREDPAQDKFSSFRNKMLRKYAWLYGYLCKLKTELEEELKELVPKDPRGKLLVGVRPSEMEAVRKKKCEEFDAEQEKLQTKLNDCLDKLSTWNSYFGPIASDYDAQNNIEEGKFDHLL